MDSARQKVKDQKAELCIVFPEDFAKQVEEYEVSSGKPAPNIAIYYNSASTDSANAYDMLCNYLDQKESAMANKFDVNRADSKADTFDMADDQRFYRAAFFFDAAIFTADFFVQRMYFRCTGIHSRRERTRYDRIFADHSGQTKPHCTW